MRCRSPACSTGPRVGSPGLQGVVSCGVTTITSASFRSITEEGFGPRDPSGRMSSVRDSFGVGGRKRSRELSAGSDPELGEYVVQVPLDGAWAEEEAGADLGVRETVAGELGDLALLCGQVVTCLGGALSQLLARCHQFTAGAFGEGLHAHRGELVVGGAELGARVDPAILAAKPLAVEQMRTGQLRPQPRAAQPSDRFAVAALGGLGFVEERP